MIRGLTVTTALIACAAMLQACTAENDHSAATHGAHGGHEHHSDASKGPITDYRELTPDEATIQEVLGTYARAMEQGSIEIMEQAVIPGDFSTIESGYPNWTWEDFRDNHLLAEFQMFTDVGYEINLLSGEFQQDLGFAIFSYTASGAFQGQSSSISGLGTAILENTAEGWRIHHMHTSAPRSQLEQIPAM